MRGTAAPAFFSLDHPSALLEQTRSPGMNASSQRARRKRGGTHITRNEWGGVGVASRKPESAPFRDVAADSSFVARRRCQTPGLDSALPVPSLRIAAPARRNRSDLPWRSRVVPHLAHQAPFAVAFLHGAHGPRRSPLHWTFLRE